MLSELGSGMTFSTPILCTLTRSLGQIYRQVNGFAGALSRLRFPGTTMQSLEEYCFARTINMKYREKFVLSHRPHSLKFFKLHVFCVACTALCLWRFVKVQEAPNRAPSFRSPGSGNSCGI